MKRILTIGILILACLGALYFLTQEKVSEPEVHQGVPTFSWSYSESQREDIPYTTIGLVATYEDGTTESKTIDTVEGNCNEYGEVDADTYSRSTMIICYYAGLGRYYKVVENDGGYAVQRKIFEEASPEYNPPQQDYETVASFESL